MYLDHKTLWSVSKERLARWIGVAKEIGNPLTFWILENQAQQIVARGVVRTFIQNLRVKWDPIFENLPDKNTDSSTEEGLPRTLVDTGDREIMT